MSKDEHKTRAQLIEELVGLRQTCALGAEDQEREERLKSILDNSNDAIALVDAEGNILYSNPTVERITGYSDEERIGRPFTELIHPDDIPAVKKTFARTVSSSKATESMELRLRHKDGSWLWIDGTGKSFIDDPSLKAIVYNYRDITERKQAEEERRKQEAKVQQAQKLESLGVLAGGVAHDFNNLLVGILGNVDLALMDLEMAAPAREYLSQIELAAKRAAGLAKQMLAYSGKGHFFIERIDFQVLVEEMVHLLKASISRLVILKYDFAKNVPFVEGDADQIRQLIMSLVVNASEALEDRSGVISICTGAMECSRAYLAETYLDDDLPEGTYSCLEISDAGCGIDSENIARIFEPFFSTKFTGRGLGLAASLGIVRGHKGAIKVNSEPGKGTTIKVLFPALQDRVE
jgi:PAS domain S-box-containing protein